MPENLPQPVGRPSRPHSGNPDSGQPEHLQPSLFPPPPPPAPPPPPGGLAPRWLQRMSLFVLVLFCIYLGVIVAILPWWSAVWDHNLFLTSHQHLWSILRLGPVRGIVSGLGLLDIWIGISEAVNYRDSPTPTND